MRQCGVWLLVVAVSIQFTLAFLVPSNHHLTGRHRSSFPSWQQRSRSVPLLRMADNNSKSIDELQQEIDAVLKEREKRRRELQQEVLTFQDEFKSVKTNIQAADIRLKNETKAFQEKLEKQKALLESVDASILEKMQQLEKLKEANEKGSSFPAANALVPLVALGVTAVVVIRQRSLEEEIDRIQKEAEAEVRRDLAKAKQQPQGPIAVCYSFCNVAPVMHHFNLHTCLLLLHIVSASHYWCFTFCCHHVQWT